jgi:hypothetical protein
MKTDQDLIFEAYAKSKPLNEGSLWGQEELVRKMREDEKARGMVRLKKEPIPGRYHGKTVHKSKVQALLDDGWELADKVDSEDAEDYNDVGVIEQLDIFIENHPEFIKQLSPIWNEMSEIAEELGKFDIDKDDIGNIEGFLDSLNTVHNQLESFMREYPEKQSQLSPILDELEDIIDELGGHYEGGHLNQDELYGIADSIGPGFAEDNENYASEGAVNLLEQLREEAPELEDKINQILGKVYDVVDILNQVRYNDDPQLVKAYASLIEDHIRTE